MSVRLKCCDGYTAQVRQGIYGYFIPEESQNEEFEFQHSGSWDNGQSNGNSRSRQDPAGRTGRQLTSTKQEYRKTAMSMSPSRTAKLKNSLFLQRKVPVSLDKVGES